MTVFPLRETIEIARTTTKKNRFNNDVTVLGPFTTVTVAGWAVQQSEEKAEDSSLRVIDDLVVYMHPDDQPGPAGKLRTPNGDVWQQEGDPEEYDYGPWFRPGLVVVHARKVTG